MDYGSNPIFELGNHLTTAVVGRRVRREQDQHINIKFDRKTPDLYISFFQNIKHPDLNQFVQFGELIHGKNPAMHPRNQPEMQGFLRRHTCPTR